MLDIKNYKFVSLLIIIVFLITQNYFTINESLDSGFSDIKSYLIISQYKFNNEQLKYIPTHHLERWPVHFLVGNFSKLINLNIHYTYLIFVIITLIFIFQIIKKIKTSDIKKISIFSFLIFNPYLYRIYICNPEMISDALFILGALLWLIGINDKNNLYIYIGLIVLVISRQTSYLIAPIIFILFYYKKINIKIFISQLILIVVMIIIIKILTASLYINHINDDYILFHLKDGWINMKNQVIKVKELSLFSARYIILIITLIPLLILINKKNVNINIIWIIFFLIINLQPIIGGPFITGGNIQRLGALGIPFLIPIIINSKLSNFQYYIFILLCFCTSFHHKFSILYFIPNSHIYFELILVGTLIFTLIIKYKNNVINNNSMF
jgi:hypothetical protein